MRQWRLHAVGILLLATAPACGTANSSFPPPAECPPPAALPTSQTVAGIASPAAFLAEVRASAASLLRLRDDFAARYPDDTFYRREAFRPDMAAFADELICTAEALRALESPIAGFDPWTAALHSALDDLLEHTRFGREAVRTRNVSQYREFRGNLDARLAAVSRVAFTSP